MQTTFRGNLSAANFPLVSEFMGRSVVIPQYDENFQRRKQFSGDDTDLDIGVPQVYYCHNVMPVGQGYKSIAYKMTIRPLAGVLNFVRAFVAKDPSENKCVIGVTDTGGVYMYTAGSVAWKDITAATGGWKGGVFSYAFANGYTYLCFSKFNTFKVDVVNKTLTAVVFSGLTMSAIVGIVSSNNYLVVHDSVTVYWSSAVNPEDFVPSLTTGAGSGTPQDINGQIVCALPLGTGFAVYTTTNIILASYSGNLRYPWLFRQAPNGAGVLKAEHVASDADNGNNYAWTSAGLLKIAAQGCQPVFPEATDFLSGRIYEDYDSATDTFSPQYLNDPMQVEIAFIASRYLVLSYGLNGDTSMTHALIHDTAFRRWGKLRLNHVACVEVGIDSEVNLTFQQLAESTYTDYSAVAFNELTTLGNTAAQAKRALAFLQSDGSVRLAVWDYGNFNSDAVAIFGKYQLTRGQLCTFEELVVEDVDASNTNFAVKIFATLDGKTVTSGATPTNSTLASKMRKYNARITGVNISFAVKGAFNLVSFLLTISRHGRR